MIKLAIMTQKGGVGKSTLTTILANRLYYYLNKKVLIVDCNIPQASVMGNRRRELELFSTIKQKKTNEEELTPKEKAWSKEFERTALALKEIRAFDVISIEDRQIGRDYSKVDEYAKDYDVILYDLPGSLEDRTLLHTMLSFNYVFVPLEPDAKSGLKSLATAAGLYNLRNMYKGKSNLQGIYLFFNKVKTSSRQHKEEMASLFQVAAQRGFEFLMKEDNTPLYIDERVRYQSDIVCSTLFSTESILRYTKVERVIQAMIKILGV